MAENWYDAVEAIHSAIVALGLATPDDVPIPAGQVYMRKVLTDRGVTLPAIVVFLAPQGETMLGGTNLRDDIGYPVGVAILVASNAEHDLTADDETYLDWRKKIRRAFNQKRLSGLGDNVICTWEPAPVMDYGVWEEMNLWVQGGIVRVTTREPRT